MIATLALLAVPFLGAAGRAIRRPARIGLWSDRLTRVAVLALAISLPWQAETAIPWLRHDRLGAFAALLVALSAAARGGGAGDWIMIGGMLLAGLSGQRLLTVAALALAVSAGLARDLPAEWRRVPLAGAGLGLFLFGSILPASPLASGCALLGLAALTGAMPALLPVMPLLALRFGGPELIAIGLAASLACAVAVLRPGEPYRPVLVALGQAGVVGMAFGLGTPDAVFAGLVLLALLVLTDAARVLAVRDGAGPDRAGLAALAAAAGMAGLPPFGLFPGLALVILAAGRQASWLLLPLLSALAGLGWSVVTRLPPPTFVAADRTSPAWIPLALALLAGFCLPAAAAEWLRSLALEVR